MRVNPEFLRKGYLKKQSQFVPEQNGAKSVVKGDYVKMPGSGAEENKANVKMGNMTLSQ